MAQFELPVRCVKGEERIHALPDECGKEKIDPESEQSSEKCESRFAVIPPDATPDKSEGTIDAKQKRQTAPGGMKKPVLIGNAAVERAGEEIGYQPDGTSVLYRPKGNAGEHRHDAEDSGVDSSQSMTRTDAIRIRGKHNLKPILRQPILAVR